MDFFNFSSNSFTIFFIVGSPKGTEAPEPRNIRICSISYEQYGHTLFDFIQKIADVSNGFSDLILTLFGSEVGMHARSAISVQALPMGLPVIIEGLVKIAQQSK